MSMFTFDLELLATVHVTANDEAAARAAIDDMICHVLEGSSWIGQTEGFINSASLKGAPALVETDGDPV